MKDILIYDDEDQEVYLPSKYEVCPNCDGKGTHVNRAIDGNGLSEELASDPDFMEGYMSGVYDVRCEQCKGEKVVSVLDESKCTPHELEQYDKHMQAEYEIRACEEAERRMGA